jgi:polyhydroxybutyrate depolymerase
MRALVSLLPLFSLICIGCGDSDTAAAPAPITCDAPGTLTPGSHLFQIEHDGLAREYRVYVPASYDGTAAAPVVFNFHGFTSNADQQVFFSGLNTTADEHGFIVVYPNGVDSSFNGGFCCGTASSEDVDDVGFALAILDEVANMGCLDRRRIYTTGMSNGGFMSHRLGCEAADTFAAIGSVTGALGITDCAPSRPMPVIQLHGTEDTLVNYDLLVLPTIDEWVELNGCNANPSETYAQGDAWCDTYDGCDDGVLVTLCTVEGGGHCWFGQDFCPFGGTSDDLISNDHLWDFFSQFWLD